MERTTKHTIVTLDNVIATSEMETWLSWMQRLDMNKWDASIHHRENGNHLYILKRKKMKPQLDTDYFEEDTPYIPDGNDLLKAIIKWMLIAVAIAGSIAIIATA